MSTIYASRQGLNQGQAIVAGWNNQATLKNITAYVGTDGNNFLPVDDRNGYFPGVTVRIPTGGTYQEGLPVIRFVSSTITDGQIKFLVDTLLSGQQSGNVTVRYHRYDNVGAISTHDANGVLNLNLEQLQQLARKQNTYSGFTWEIVIVEPL